MTCSITCAVISEVEAGIINAGPLIFSDLVQPALGITKSVASLVLLILGATAIIKGSISKEVPKILLMVGVLPLLTWTLQSGGYQWVYENLFGLITSLLYQMDATVLSHSAFIKIPGLTNIQASSLGMMTALDTLLWAIYDGLLKVYDVSGMVQKIPVFLMLVLLAIPFTLSLVTWCAYLISISFWVFVCTALSPVLLCLAAFQKTRFFVVNALKSTLTAGITVLIGCLAMVLIGQPLTQTVTNFTGSTSNTAIFDINNYQGPSKPCGVDDLNCQLDGQQGLPSAQDQSVNVPPAKSFNIFSSDFFALMFMGALLYVLLNKAQAMATNLVGMQGTTPVGAIAGMVSVAAAGAVTMGISAARSAPGAGQAVGQFLQNYRNNSPSNPSSASNDSTSLSNALGGGSDNSSQTAASAVKRAASGTNGGAGDLNTPDLIKTFNQMNQTLSKIAKSMEDTPK